MTGGLLPLLAAAAVGLTTLPRALAQGNIVTIDDADSTIEYHGFWIPNPGVPDTPMNNYGGTLTFSNASGSTATVSFTGEPSLDDAVLHHRVLTAAVRAIFHLDGAGSKVAVYGAYNVGTFDMNAHFTIDDGEPTGLVITNLGDQFWLDFIQVEVDPSQSVGTQGAQGPSAAPPSLTSEDQPRSSTASASVQKQTTALSDSEEQGSAHETEEADATNESTISGITSLVASSTAIGTDASPLQTSKSTDIAPGGASTGSPRSSLGTPAGSPVMATSAIVGVAVAGVVLLALVVLGGCWWRKKRRAAGGAIIGSLGFDAVPTMSSSFSPTDTAAEGRKSQYSSPISPISSSAAFLPPPAPPSSSASHSTTRRFSSVYGSSAGFTEYDTSPSVTRPVTASEESGNHPRQTDRRTATDSQFSHFFPRPSTSKSRLTTANADMDTDSPPLTPLSPVETNADGITPLRPRPVQRRSGDGDTRVVGAPSGRVRRRSRQMDELQIVASTLPPPYQLSPPA